MVDEADSNKTPAWYLKWKMIVGVIAGIGVIFTVGFAARSYLEWGLTVDVRARLDIIEGQIDDLIASVDGLKIVVTDKEYETDKDLILLVIEAYEKKQLLARTPYE